jgi:hypothetical protein
MIVVCELFRADLVKLGGLWDNGEHVDGIKLSWPVNVNIIRNHCSDDGWFILNYVLVAYTNLVKRISWLISRYALE